MKVEYMITFEDTENAGAIGYYFWGAGHNRFRLAKLDSKEL